MQTLCFPQHKAKVSNLLFDFLEFHYLLPFHEAPEICHANCLTHSCKFST